MEEKRIPPKEAAKQFVDQTFPKAQGALLAGSVVRGEATNTSDLDIVIFDNTIDSPYRESLVYLNWPVEVFVHTLTSYKDFFASDYERARPSLQRMVSEGVILKDSGIIQTIKAEGNETLEIGPEKWSQQTIRLKRYFITDLLDDFIGSTDRSEQLFIVNSLAESVHEFVLRTNGHWIGSSKWVVKALKQFDEEFTNQFVIALETFYRTNEKEKIIELVETILEPYGGRLFNEFSIGKD